MSSSMLLYLEFVGVFILLVWAFYITFRAGLLYNGPIYCMSIGGYFAAFAVRDLGWPFGLALIGALVVGAIFGFLPALGFSRTTGIVTAVASMALIFIVQSVIRNLAFLGGPFGFWNIPKVDYLLPITWVLVLIVGVFIYRLDHSRVGRAREVIGTDPELAHTMGIDVKWLNVYALTLSSVIGALAGVIFAFTMRTIQVESFGFPLLLTSSTMLFIGGRYTMWGAIIAVPLLWGLPQWIPSEAAVYSNLIYGILLITTLVLRPEGLVTRESLQRLKASGKLWLKNIKGFSSGGKRG